MEVDVIGGAFLLRDGKVICLYPAAVFFIEEEMLAVSCRTDEMRKLDSDYDASDDIEVEMPNIAGEVKMALLHIFPSFSRRGKLI